MATSSAERDARMACSCAGRQATTRGEVLGLRLVPAGWRSETGVLGEPWICFWEGKVNQSMWIFF